MLYIKPFFSLKSTLYEMKKAQETEVRKIPLELKYIQKPTLYNQIVCANDKYTTLYNDLHTC
jgi:hypothetical protein